MVRIFLTLLRLVWRPWLGLLMATLKMLGITLASMWRGTLEATQNLAEYWTFQAVSSGFPATHARILEYIFRVAAFLTVLTGWVILSHLTVFLFRWLVWR
jgi:hypothetical protein